MRGTVAARPVRLRVRVVGGRAGRRRARLDARSGVGAAGEREGRAPGVDTARIVLLVPDETRQRVARSRTVEHGGDRRPRLRVVVDHIVSPVRNNLQY